VKARRYIQKYVDAVNVGLQYIWIVVVTAVSIYRMIFWIFIWFHYKMANLVQGSNWERQKTSNGFYLLVVCILANRHWLLNMATEVQRFCR